MECSISFESSLCKDYESALEKAFGYLAFDMTLKNYYKYNKLSIKSKEIKKSLFDLENCWPVALIGWLVCLSINQFLFKQNTTK